MFSENLKRIRKEKNMTQQHIADKLGISRQGYSNYEKDNYSPNLDIANKIAKCLNVPLKYLLFRHDFIDEKDYNIKMQIISKTNNLEKITSMVENTKFLSEFHKDTIPDKIEKLNYDGILKLNSYLDDLLNLDYYTGNSKAEDFVQKINEMDDK